MFLLEQINLPTIWLIGELTDRKINNVSIDDHELTGLDVVTAAVLLDTQKGPVIAIFHEQSTATHQQHQQHQQQEQNNNQQQQNALRQKNTTKQRQQQQQATMQQQQSPMTKKDDTTTKQQQQTQPHQRYVFARANQSTNHLVDRGANRQEDQ